MSGAWRVQPPPCRPARSLVAARASAQQPAAPKGRDPRRRTGAAASTAEYRVSAPSCLALRPPGLLQTPRPNAIYATILPQELLRELEALGEAELAAWAAAHRDRLSLSFLGWLSEEELASAAEEPPRQQALWELGSRLMALREGLSPVANDVLQAELRAAALSCSGTDSCSSAEEADDAAADTADAQRRQEWLRGAAAQQAQRAQQGAPPAALATPSFASAVQRTAALGLSPEGMVLFEQQAAALEAVVGTSRARSLTEVIGRAKVQDARQMQRLAESDAAVSAARVASMLLEAVAAGPAAHATAACACCPALRHLALPQPECMPRHVPAPPWWIRHSITCTLLHSHSQVRILDVLLSVHDRQARAAMLPDAFTPPGSTAGVRCRQPALWLPSCLVAEQHSVALQTVLLLC